MSLRLTAIDGSLSFELRPGARLVVGRAPEADIVLFHSTVSRRHAELTCRPDGVHVRDLGSQNGTFVRGARVESAELRVGDAVTFGSAPFRVDPTAATPAPTPARASGPAGGRTDPGTHERPTPAAAVEPHVTLLRPVLAPDDLLATALRTPAAAALPDTGRAERVARRLARLLEVSQGLSGGLGADALLEKIVDYVFHVMDAEWAAVLLVHESSEPAERVARHRAGAGGPRTVPRSIAGKVMRERVAVLSLDLTDDQRFGGASIAAQHVRSAMCAPLVGRSGDVLGAIYVDSVMAPHRFAEEDLDFLGAFAGVAAAAIENERLGERLRREALVRSNFERYFAPSVADRIARTPDIVAVGGDRRTVAVLFSDLRGFTPLAESMRPDDLAALLSEYFGAMVECVFRHGGALDKFIGDAILAQWGAPIASPDDADRALGAAVDMLRELAALNVKWRGEGRPELQVGVGMSFGEVFAGNIGSERRLEFTVLGDVVNTAARLCAAAGAGEILLTDDLRRALAAPPALEERPPMQLKGKAQPVAVCCVVGDGAGPRDAGADGRR